MKDDADDATRHLEDDVGDEYGYDHRPFFYGQKGYNLEDDSADDLVDNLWDDCYANSAAESRGRIGGRFGRRLDGNVDDNEDDVENDGNCSKGGISHF